MPRILIVTEETAQEAQRPLVEQMKRKIGKLAGIHQVLLTDPEMATHGGQLYAHLNLRPDSPFTRLQRELLATLVYGLISETSCSCLGVHAEAVRRLTHDPGFGPNFVRTWPTSEVSSKTRALLAYAARLTETPGRIDDADIDELRAVGWNEQAIYEATALISLHNMLGRMETAAGLTPDQIPADVVFPEAIPDGREKQA
jgi:uncharacterized peroxidase-related enzyme